MITSTMPVPILTHSNLIAGSPSFAITRSTRRGGICRNI